MVFLMIQKRDRSNTRIVTRLADDADQAKEWIRARLGADALAWAHYDDPAIPFEGPAHRAKHGKYDLTVLEPRHANDDAGHSDDEEIPTGYAASAIAGLKRAADAHCSAALSPREVRGLLDELGRLQFEIDSVSSALDTATAALHRRRGG